MSTLAPSHRMPASPPPAPPGGRTISPRLLGVVFTVAAGGLGVLVAGQKFKNVVAVAGAMVLIAVLTVSRRREQVVLGVMVASVAFMLHKSIGGIAAGDNSGPPSIYITGLDALVVVLYCMWARTGTLGADLRAGFRRPILWIPLVPALAALPSLLIAPSIRLGVNELVRMAWMYALFVYVALRVRTVSQVITILRALGFVVILELLVVLAQWKTHGTFGVSFLGTPTELGTRVFNDGTAGRPFGTVTHPVFMGALLAPMAILALSLAVAMAPRRTKLTCLALAFMAAAPLAISNVRASLVAMSAACAVVVVVGLVQRRLTAVTLVTAITIGAVAAGIAWPVVSSQINRSFGSQHYSLEVQSRTQLNDVAMAMIADRPLIGAGLNNFQVQMKPYEVTSLIFADNPVHNLYLLITAETGVVGMAGMAVLWIALVWAALRLARSRDRLGAALGLGATAAYLFFALEELLGFSLREDAPLAFFWILAGLVVAGGSMFAGSGRASSRRLPAAAGQRP